MLQAVLPPSSDTWHSQPILGVPYTTTTTKHTPTIYQSSHVCGCYRSSYHRQVTPGTVSLYLVRRTQQQQQPNTHTYYLPVKPCVWMLQAVLPPPSDTWHSQPILGAPYTTTTTKHTPTIYQSSHVCGCYRPSCYRQVIPGTVSLLEKCNL